MQNASARRRQKKKTPKNTEIVEIVPRLRQHKGNRKKGLNVAQCVSVHTSVQLKGFSAGSVNSRPGSCPLARLRFLPAAPRCPASQRRCSETQHTKWDVTRAAILFYLYWMGRHCGERCKKALTCCLMRSGGSPSPRRSLCNFHPHIQGWKADLTPSSSTPSPPPTASPTFPQRQRKTVDNYLVWNFLAVSVSATQCVGVTKLIFDCGFEDMQQGYCGDACVGGALPRVKEQF